jgi:hypothetical protein
MCTIRPFSGRHDVSGSSSPRRDNPKSCMNGGSGEGGRYGEGMLVVPQPGEKPKYNVVVEYMGLKLCRISDAVPYREYSPTYLTSHPTRRGKLMR